MSYAELNFKYNNLLKSKNILDAEVSKTYESSLIQSNDRPSFNNLQNLIERFETLETYVNEAKKNSDSLDYTAISGKLQTLTESIGSYIDQLNNFLTSLTSSSREAFEELLTEYNKCSTTTFENCQNSYNTSKDLYLGACQIINDPDIEDSKKEFSIMQRKTQLSNMNTGIENMQDVLDKMQKLSDAGLRLERVVSNTNSATTYTGGKFQTTYFDQPY